MKALRRTAQRIVKDVVALRADENLCVVSEFEKARIARALAHAGREVGAEAIVCLMSRRKMHGNELPAVIAAAMKEADVVIAPTTYAITHTEARRAASQKGARTVILRSVTEETFTEGAIMADYQEVNRLSMALGEILTRASTVRVTTRLGTDARFSIEGRAALCLGGFARSPGSLTSLPSGEAAISPVEGKTEGQLVIDHLIDGVGLLQQPVTVVIEQGRAVDFSGGREALRLRRLLSAADPHAYNVAEFAIGANPLSRMLGNPAEDKILLGCVHVALGDNRSLGGQVASELHLDMTILRPTVEVDGQMILRDGKLVGMIYGST
jgi:leucyl aminopeptidase (aminopeptidase T)